MKRNADLRSLRIDLADAGLGSGRMPDLRVFWDAQRFGLGYTHCAPLERGG